MRPPGTDSKTAPVLLLSLPMNHFFLGQCPAVAAIVLGAMLFASARAGDPGFADPLLGRWDLTVHGHGGAYPSWLEVRLRTEHSLMARFVGRFGSARYIPELSYRDGVVEFHVADQYEGYDLVFNGRLENDRMTGHTFAADGGVLEWNAVRAPSLSRERPAQPGKPIELFDRRSLDGWRLRFDGNNACWRVEGGRLRAAPPCVDLVSEQRFDDFRLVAEFRYPPGSNSGIYLRGRYEVQIQDDRGKALDPLRIGAVYGFIAPRIDAAKPADEWQRFDITLVGRTITVMLNGVTIIDGEVIPGITGGALDSDEGAPGPVLLQGDHGPIEFRRLTLTPL